MSDKNFETFTADVMRQRVDPYKLSLAREWYKKFTGKASVNHDEKDLVDMYEAIH